MADRTSFEQVRELLARVEDLVPLDDDESDDGEGLAVESRRNSLSADFPGESAYTSEASALGTDSMASSRSKEKKSAFRQDYPKPSEPFNTHDSDSEDAAWHDRELNGESGETDSHEDKLGSPKLALLSNEELRLHNLLPAVQPKESSDEEFKTDEQFQTQLTVPATQDEDEYSENGDSESELIRVKISDSEYWNLVEQVWEKENNGIEEISNLVASQSLGESDDMKKKNENKEPLQSSSVNNGHATSGTDPKDSSSQTKRTPKLETFQLNVIHQIGRTGFEATKKLQVFQGMVLANRYAVINEVGEAAFSTALRCVDLAKRRQRRHEHSNSSCSSSSGSSSNKSSAQSDQVCIKVIKNKKDFFDQSLDEIRLLKLLNTSGDVDKHRVIKLIDYFYHKEHLFLVTELLGPNLYNALQQDAGKSEVDRLFSLKNIKSIAAQVLGALSYIASLNIIHCDLKPENILLKPSTTVDDVQVKLIDFGSSCFLEDRLSSYIQSRFYRAPEVVLGASYDTGIDIWSLGACLAELHTGRVLFHCNTSQVLLAKMVSTLGPLPRQMVANSRMASAWFLGDTIVEKDEEDGEYNLIYPRQGALYQKIGREGPEDPFCSFVGHLLTLSPNVRPSAEQALKHKWLQPSA